MSGDPASRAERSGGLLLASVVAALLAGGAGWYLYSQRGDGAADDGGFDLSSAPRSRTVVRAAAPAAAPSSGLAMVQGDEFTRSLAASKAAAGPPPARAAAPPAAPPPSAATVEDSRRNFTTAARKHEGSVRAYSKRMTAKYPVILQYGRDWMSHPDLRKLSDDYQRDHDPIAFMAALARSPSFPAIVRQYAGKPEIREFVVYGVMKEAPSELLNAGLDLLQKDAGAKTIAATASAGIGLPPSLAAALSGDPSKIDQQRVVKDISESPAGRGNGAPITP